ncbi:MAG: hypothetical protein KAU28_01740, partial [Phycisphaerae bacterium]|nr:hypothetical protein [Phycisphaerae bacterium]
SNSALWFDRSWRSSAQYSKVHLVPFSEYVPFKYTWPSLYKTLRWFVPPVMAQLEPGRGFTRFELIRSDGDGKNIWHIASPICYEGTFARICRKMVVRNGKKDVDILANISNDGWFVYSWNNRYRGSNEHAQHLASYCFRAVENRVPVVRAVNTGISASINSNGKIEAAVERKFDDYVKRDMVSGRLLLGAEEPIDKEYLTVHGPRVLVDTRVSVYSLVGDIFAMAISMAAILLAISLAWKRKRIV